MSWTVIVPSNRPEEVVKFHRAWVYLFQKHDVHLVMMWDLPELPWETPDSGHKITQLCWKDIDASGLKHIPRKTDMIRSYAFLWAYKNTNSKYFLTLDDDVMPIVDKDIFEEYEKVFEEGAPCSEYLDVGALTSSGLQMRGFPYKDRKKAIVAVQYGGWNGVLDFDAATQLAVPKEFSEFKGIVMPVPKGAAVTCCIMNCAWRRSYTPIMWQLPMLDGRYNRVGDIWSGLFIKRTLDFTGAVMVINGKASVWHDRASNPYNSLVKEAPGAWLNDNLWDFLRYPLTDAEYENNLPHVYDAVTTEALMFFLEHDKEYAEHFLKARDEWQESFK